MPRGYRLLFLAVGLILAGASEPPEHQRQGEGRAAKQQSNQPNPTASEGGQPANYQKPCKREDRNRDSDLCAQWTAADAARDAADWAFLSLWLTGASLIGLFVTLGFNYAAWDQARKSKGDTIRALNAADRSADAATRLAEVADLNTRKELRAYLDFDGVWLEEFPQHNGANPNELGMRLRIQLKNYGKTPAENAVANIATMAKAVNQPNFLPITEEHRKEITSIAPNDEFKFRFIWQVTQIIFNSLKNKALICRIALIVTYTDVFGDPHVLRCEFEGNNGIADEFSMVEGTRAST